VIVVDFGGVLARVGAQDPSGALDEPSFPPNRGGEEQGVQGGAVEALARVRPGRDDEQRRVVPIRPRGRIKQPSMVSSNFCRNRDTFQVDRIRCRSQNSLVMH
jgi:hypothetical protein